VDAPDRRTGRHDRTNKALPNEFVGAVRLVPQVTGVPAEARNFQLDLSQSLT
jgi:hypothetical protein